MCRRNSSQDSSPNLAGIRVCRNGYHSLNIQLICNAECTIINYVVKWPGSTHDARILRESLIYSEFEEGLHEGIILGDSGYSGMRKDTMGLIGQLEQNLTVIERCNGILNRIFHCLHGELRVSPERGCNIIAACIILHNRAVDYKHPVDEGDISVEPFDDGERNYTQSTQGALMRQRIVSSHFSH